MPIFLVVMSFSTLPGLFVLAFHQRGKFTLGLNLFLRKKKPRRLASGVRKIVLLKLTFRELEAFACAGLAVLLALLHTRVACEEAVGFEHRAKVGIYFE